MKKLLLFLVVLAIAVITGSYQWEKQQYVDVLQDNTLSVLLVHGNGKEKSVGIRAFASVLEEEGVAYTIVSNSKLITTNPEMLVKHKPVLIYPDKAAQILSADMQGWLRRYLEAGGYVELASDVGSKRNDGTYWIDGGVFDTIVGVERNIGKGEERGPQFLSGPIKFSDKKSAQYFEIPEGKRDKAERIVGYRYGVLQYSYEHFHIHNQSEAEVYAWGEQEGKKTPLLMLLNIKKGKLLFVNLPLAYLKGHSDDLLLRSTLRTFLFKIVHFPHIVSSPDAKGGLVLNLHVDYNEERTILPKCIEQGFISPKLKYSIHITAGPDCNTPGDGEGFDADGKGKAIVQEVEKFGTIGSHGGWAHNWFSKSILDGSLDRVEIKKYIQMNNKALEKITGYQIKEYSAPNGVFLQPEFTGILQELGMESYYYTGDSGSAPNRTFFDNMMVSKKLIAFPVMSTGNMASLYEYRKAGIGEEELVKLLTDIVDYTVSNRVVRLMYTHPHDIFDEHYESAAKTFIEYCIAHQESGKLHVASMSFFRDFLIRVTETKKVLKWHNGVLEVSLDSPHGLGGMVLAIPRRIMGKSLKLQDVLEKDEVYWYVPTDTNAARYYRAFKYE